MRAVEHYVEAEKLLTRAALFGSDGHHDTAMEYLAAAQANATLALAGATALQSYCTGEGTELADWETATGGPPT